MAAPTAVGTAEATKPASEETRADMTQNNPYFKAGGEAPEWSLDLSPTKIVLATGEGTFTTPHSEPEKGGDANIKRYHLQTEAVELILEIHQKPCDLAALPGQPYSVKVQYRRTADPGLRSLEGCGTYVMDYRLHDIWALESLGGNGVTLPEGTERPNMELNSTTREFTGSTSCNRMRGKVFFEPGLLRFSDIATTRKMCPGSLEADFLKALQSSMHYRLENNRLYLTNPQGVALVFRKVD
jgi:heat shock protein HslJ